MTLLDPVRYAAANASVRARLSRLLPADIWRAILAASDFGEIVSLLSQTAYQPTLEPVTAQMATLETVERELWAYLAHSYRSLLKLLQGHPRRLLDWLWRRLELDNLKVIIRGIGGEVPPRQIQASLIPLNPLVELPWRSLAEMTSIPELITGLRLTYYGSFYARALEQALERYRREGETFGLEVSLDLAYYRRLLKLLDQLSGRDRREAEQLIGTMVDGQNLLWAFRYRIYFDLSPEEILNYTLQRWLRVDAAVVRDIATGGLITDIVTAVWGDDLLGLDRLAGQSPAEALPKLELIFRRHLYNLALSAQQGYPFHLGTILAYVLLLESEIRDLVTIIEGKTAGVSPDQIRPYLIGQRG